MTKTEQAIRVLEQAMRDGYNYMSAAKEAEKKTGLRILPKEPVVYERFGFVLLRPDSEEMLHFHALFSRTRLEDHKM